LIDIITARVEELCKMINKKLDEHGLKDVSNHRVVLTGGCSNLVGIRNTASIILDKQVRIGVPRNIANMPQALCCPEYSTVIGLLLFAAKSSEKVNYAEYEPLVGSANVGNGLIKSIFSRLKQNF